MWTKKIEGPSKKEIQKLNWQLRTKIILQAQVKGKFKNLTAYRGPKKFEGPSKKELQKLDLQLCTQKNWSSK